MGVHILCCSLRNGVSYHSHMFLSWCSSKEASELNPHFWHLVKCPLLGSPQPVVGRGCTHYFLYWIIFPNHLSKRVKVLIIFLFFLFFFFFFFSSIFWSPPVIGEKAVDPPLAGFTPDLTLLEGCWRIVGLLYYSRFPRERNSIGDACSYIYVYYKLLTHVMMEAEHSWPAFYKQRSRK